MTSVALHALWDAWIHERDITLPLGLPPVVEDDEVTACLYYCSAIGPAFQALSGSARAGALTISASDPEVLFTIECGPTVVVREGASDTAARLEGRADVLVDGLTFRAPLEHRLTPNEVWMLGGLDEVFDRVS
jgi:hypothetical protein